MGQILCIIGSVICIIFGLVFRKMHKDNIWINGERLKNNKQAAILSLLACISYASCAALIILNTKLGT